MKIKIYDKSYSPLSTLLQSGASSDFNNLEYREVLHEIGTARFNMRLDNPKTSLENLKHYNIVEIVDDDGTTVRWVGVIFYKEVQFNIVIVTCYSLIFLLSRRLTASSVVFNNTAGNVVSSILSTTNGIEDTKIIAGTLNASTNVNLTLNRAPLFNTLKTIAESANAQFRVKPNRQLDFMNVIGTDLSGSILFQYDFSLIASANILRFSVDDDGKQINSKAYGESGALSSSQEDAGIRTSYGLHEKYKNFREISDQNTLNGITSDMNRIEEFSPAIALSPEIEDNFDVGDIVSVKLKNRLIDIDDTFQVLEKRVRIRGGQKEIIIRVNDIPTDFLREIKDIQQDVDLLSREV